MTASRKAAGVSSDKLQADRYDNFLDQTALKTKLIPLAAICGLRTAAAEY